MKLEFGLEIEVNDFVIVSTARQSGKSVRMNTIIEFYRTLYGTAKPENNRAILEREKHRSFRRLL